MSDFPQFPEGFVFGVSTAAYQIEGAPSEDGKGPSIWDDFAHRKGKIRGGVTGDLACDHYHRYSEDVTIMKALGLNAYRFSISWPRVIPEGEGKVNEKGLDFYSKLTDRLLENGITPFPTLFHWDLPLELQKKYGGFVNRRTAELFADYSEMIVRRLGDRIKNWITVNEPFEFSCFGHALGTHAPGYHNIFLYFKVLHNVLLGHGLALERIKGIRPEASVGAALSLTPIHPASGSEEDGRAAALANQLLNDITLQPMFNGSYPEPLWSKVRLLRPSVREGDMRVISRPVDFVGINNYQREFATYKWFVPVLHMDLSGKDIAEHAYVKDGVQHTSMGWEVYPNAIYESLMIVKNSYGNPPVFITENGAAFDDAVSTDGRIHDGLRIDYLSSYLSRVSAAAKEGSNVRGYFAWSLMDNFEWAAGYSKRFGLVYIDYPSQRRIVKDSGYWYSDLIKAQAPKGHGSAMRLNN
jgi:beta-glucosidase